MFSYIGRHWRGEHSLARSYWVNAVLVSLVLQLAVTLAEDSLAELRIETSLYVALILIASLALITVWQLVGVWRSATNSALRTGRFLWPNVAKGIVILGGLGGAFAVATATVDISNVWKALRDVDIAGYSLERVGDTDLILSGAINDQSADAVILALEDPKIEILRIDSHGGLIDPAVRLARYVRDNEVFVLAEGQCISACVLVLIASPTPALEAGTPVVFHASQPAVEFTNPDLRKESQRYLDQTEEFDREFGVPAWVSANLKQQEFWTATVEELIQMDLLAYVYDPEAQDFVAAQVYCLSHQAICAERMNYNLEAE